MGSELVFIIGDKLPYISEAVMAIYSYAPGGKPTAETEKCKAAINAYTIALINKWSMAFGSEYIQSRKTVSCKLRNHLKSYYNSVINVKKNTPKDKLGERQRKRNWRAENEVLFELFKKDVNINDDQIFNKETRDFYNAQKNSPLHTGYISDQIDESYVPPVPPQYEYAEDLDDIDSEFADSQEHLLYQSINRSGFSPITKKMNNQEIQTDKVNIEQPEIRGKRKLTDEIKRTCTQVSIECGISLEKSHKAVQVVSRELYNHEYLLDRPLENQVESHDASGTESSKRRSLKWDAAMSEQYKWVLPSRQTLIDWKHLQATQSETEAAISLFQKQDDVYVTLHYDTTSKNSIDGE